MVSSNGNDDCKPEVIENGHLSPQSNGHDQARTPAAALALDNNKQKSKMQSEDSPDSLKLQFIAICEKVCDLDVVIKKESHRLFDKVRPFLISSIGSIGSGTEDQMLQMWASCIMYCTSKLCPELQEISTCKLSHILEKVHVSVLDFFKELRLFLHKTNSVLQAEYGLACDKLKQVKDLQSNFSNMAALFNYYKRNYNIFFLSSRMTSCSCSQNSTLITCDHLRFGWLVFLALRKHVLTQFDLVTCTNGLIAILAIMIIHVPVHRRKFSSFKNDLFAVRSLAGVNIVASLCQLYDASEEDVQKMVEKTGDMIAKILKVAHVVKPSNQPEQLTDIDTERVVYFEGLMGENALCNHLQMLNKDYEEYFTQSGELDERMFLESSDTAVSMLQDSPGPMTEAFASSKRKHETMIMSPVKSYSLKGSFLSSPDSPKPSPMKTNSNRMLPPTPITSTMTSAKWLRTVIGPMSAEPSTELLHFLKSCDSDVTKHVKNRAQIILEAIFSSEKRANWGTKGINGLAAIDNIWAEQRRLEALKLYYRVLGSMCQAESQRLQSDNLSALLANERFHRCMLACSAELVLATYKTVSLNFPAVLEPTGITAFDVWKVIESFVRHEETLPRELKRHLNSIEEKILEKLAWDKGSSLYNSLIIAKPNLQAEIDRLGLLAEPMPSLETLHTRYQLLDASSRMDSQLNEKHGLLSSPIKPSLWSGSIYTEKAFLSPLKERQATNSTGKTRLQPPLLSAFASPHKPSQVGGETCAESVVNIFLQKVLKLAAIRIKILCESLKQQNSIMEDVYKTMQHIVYNETGLFFKRHMDQIILCSMYGVCKVQQSNVTFRQIIQHYKQIPHDSYIYKTVFFDLPTAKPVREGQGTGDIINFYNLIFVPATKSFLVKLNTPSTAGPEQSTENTKKTEIKPPESPGPSPFSSLPDMSPKKVSSKHNVYVSPLRSSKIEPLRSPTTRSLYACVGESPSKDLAEINSRVNNRRFGRLDFGDAGLVSDSLVAGNLYVLNNSSSGKSIAADPQQQSQPQHSRQDEQPQKRLCMDR